MLTVGAITEWPEPNGHVGQTGAWQPVHSTARNCKETVMRRDGRIAFEEELARGVPKATILDPGEVINYKKLLAASNFIARYILNSAQRYIKRNPKIRNPKP